MITKTHRNIVGVITCDEVSSSAWVEALTDRLQKESEVVLLTSQELAEQTHILRDGICVARSLSDSVLRTLIEMNAEVILLSDAIERSVPEHWVILPWASSPLNVAKIAVLLLQRKSLVERQSIPETKIESATYAHGHSIWESVAQFSSAVENASSPSSLLRRAVPLLNDSLYGARVVRIVVEKEPGEYSLLKPGKEWISPLKVSPGLMAEIQSGNRVMDASAGRELRQHLACYNADLMVSVRWKQAVRGWFLIAIEDYHQMFLNKPLAQKIASHIGLLVDCGEQISELTSFRHAVREGLDQLETGISILNKQGSPLVENRAAYEISQKLGCSSTHLIPEVRTAIHKARLGYPTETVLDEYAVRTSAWGSLHNGCVLQTRSRLVREDNCVCALNAWMKEWQTTASKMGLELNVKIESEEDLSVAVSENLSIESVCRYLLDGQMSRKINVTCEVVSRTVRLHFDQEFSEGICPRSELFQRAPAGVEIENASLGRRVAIALLRHDTPPEAEPAPSFELLQRA